MLSRLRFATAALRERLWVGPAQNALGALSLVGLALLSDRIPADLPVPEVSLDALRALLSVLASTLLGVATFAVASMVQAYASASTNATPRAFALVVADGMSRRALSVFVAGYIFAIIGLIAVHVVAPAAIARFVLLVATISIVAWVVLTFVAWVDSIARLGRMGDTIGKLESATLAALRTWSGLAGASADAQVMPAHALEIRASWPSGSVEPDAAERAIGHLQLVDAARLQDWAEGAGARVYVHCAPGAFVTPGLLLASVAFDAGRERPGVDDVAAAVKPAFVVGADRSFQQDPRFGALCLGEIGSRALSPGINDPGTAVDVIKRFVRILLCWQAQDPPAAAGAQNRVHLPPMDVATLLQDAFGALERDGANRVEIALWLQDAYARLADLGTPALAEAARARAEAARQRSQTALTIAEDRDRLANHPAEPGNSFR